MRRLSIPARIVLAFSLMIAGFVGVSAGSIHQHQRTTEDLKLLNDGYLPLLVRLGEAKSQQAAFARQIEHGLHGDSLPWFNAALQLRPSTLRQLEHHLQRAERLAPGYGSSDSFLALEQSVDMLRNDFDGGTEHYDALFGAIEEGGEVRQLTAAVIDREAQTGLHFREAYNLLQDRIHAISVDTAERERQSGVVLSALAVVALLMAVVITWWTQRLLRPLPLLQQRVAIVGRGDLQPREPVSMRDDELGRLATGFETMVQALALRDERLGALRRLQQEIVDGLRTAVLVVDEEGVLRSTNRAAHHVLGLSEQAPGQSLATLGLIRGLPPLKEAIESVRTKHRNVRLESQRFEHEDDDSSAERFLDVLVTPLGSDPNDPRVLVVVQDVTEALETKSRLVDSERLAAIGRMAAHVTHEVRNPLSSIGLNVEMLVDELPPEAEEARTLIKAVQKEIERLRAITEEYLRLARVPQPRLEMEDLGDFLRVLVDFVRPEFEAAGLVFTAVIDDTLPLLAFDESQLRQALLNLLRNAREASTGNDGREVILSATSDRGGARLVVQDDGPGIAPDTRGQVFDLFFTTKSDGTGLGLSLTQQIIMAHGGAITCEDTHLGSGTRFTISLPANP